MNPNIVRASIVGNTLTFLKNRHTEWTGDTIGDRLKLEPN